MAEFEVNVIPVRIEPHDNADALEIACIGGYRSVVRKGQFQTGDLVAYIPEQAVLPEALLVEMGLEGRLAGAKRNRVKAIKLRGVLSQGLCYPARNGWEEGQNVADLLGVEKYQPPVPSHMNGALYGAGFDRCMRYDIENIKKYPDVFVEGEAVVMAEKLHGTWTQLGVVSVEDADEVHGRLVVASKGVAAKGLAFIPNVEENAHNLYLRVARMLDIEEKLSHFEHSVFVLGETFGQGVQDLDYGASTRSDEVLGFRVFDVYVGRPGHGHYLNDEALEDFCQTYGLARVPVLYRGPFSEAVLAEMTRGKETISGEARHMREGVIVRPVEERVDDALGRVQLKSVSAQYLLRKGGTELN